MNTQDDRRQSARFTANARWSLTPGHKLHLPKIGMCPCGGRARYRRRRPA